jgi:hypothetical protein
MRATATILLIALLTNQSLGACTANSVDDGVGDTATLNKFTAGKCCTTTGTTNVKDTAAVDTCATASGSPPAEINAAKCNTNYYLNNGACTACGAGTTTVRGYATLDANAETACFQCPDGTRDCTISCTLDGNFKCPTTQGAVTYTATACLDTFVLKATSPPTCVASAANCKTGTATNATPSVETCTACVSGYVLKATSPATCVTPATAGCTAGTATNATPSVETCSECGADGYRSGPPAGSPAVCT